VTHDTRETFVQVNSKLLYYNLSLGGMLFLSQHRHHQKRLCNYFDFAFQIVNFGAIKSLGVWYGITVLTSFKPTTIS
jgi:hypothetical protein